MLTSCKFSLFANDRHGDLVSKEIFRAGAYLLLLDLRLADHTGLMEGSGSIDVIDIEEIEDPGRPGESEEPQTVPDDLPWETSAFKVLGYKRDPCAGTKLFKVVCNVCGWRTDGFTSKHRLVHHILQTGHGCKNDALRVPSSPPAGCRGLGMATLPRWRVFAPGRTASYHYQRSTCWVP
jgi:hypothetical protein